MTWETLSWRTATDPPGLAGDALGDLLPTLASALTEALAARVKASVTLTDLAVTETVGGELPDGFAGIGSFELPSTPNRGAWLALDPSAGREIGGVEIESASVGRLFGEAVVETIATQFGETIALDWTPPPALDTIDEVILVRLRFRDGEGREIGVVAAFVAAVAGEFATHMAALRAVGAPESPARVGDAAPTTDPAELSPADAAAPGTDPAPPASVPGVHPLILDELASAHSAAPPQSIELLLGVNLQVTVEIGRTSILIRDVLGLTPGSIIELDKLAGEKVDILVNGHRIALGEVVVVDDNFGVRVTDIVSRNRRLASSTGAA